MYVCTAVKCAHAHTLNASSHNTCTRMLNATQQRSYQAAENSRRSAEYCPSLGSFGGGPFTTAFSFSKIVADLLQGNLPSANSNCTCVGGGEGVIKLVFGSDTNPYITESCCLSLYTTVTNTSFQASTFSNTQNTPKTPQLLLVIVCV